MGKHVERMARMARTLDPDPASVSLLAVTDPKRLADPWAALRALPRGSALIWRSYDKRPDYETARRLAAAARAKGCVLILAGAPELARRLGMAGIHLPERAIRRHRSGTFLRETPDAIITAACHSERAIFAAARARADAVLISPVMPTESHVGAKALGIPRFAALVRTANSLGLAAYALGGISTPAQAARLRGTGADGIAGIGFILDSGN